MNRNGYNRRRFYVVQFMEMPFEGIDDYVCVPYSWMVVCRELDQKAAVAYPKDENPFDTRDRVKRQERYDDEWRTYMAAVKYESDTYRDAEFWIATRNDYGPLVEKTSTMSVPDTPSRFRLSKKSHSANESNSSKSNDHPRKRLPKMSIKLPALTGPKKKLGGTRLKLDEAAQSSVVNDANADPGCLKRGQSISIQYNQLMECAATKETAAAFNGNESTEPRTQTQPTEQNKQALSVPVIDVDEPMGVMNINENDHSQDVKMPDKNNIISQRHLSNNTTAALIIAAEPSTLAEQTPRPNQHNNHLPLEAQSPLNLMGQTGSPSTQSCMSIGISIKPKINRKIRNLQGVMKKTPPAVPPNVLSSVQRALLNTRNYLLNAKSTEYNNTSLPTGPHSIAALATRDNQNLEMSTCSFQQLPGIQHRSAHRNINQNQYTQRESVNQYTGTNSTGKRVHFMNDIATSTIDGNFLNVTDNECQTDECMMEGSLSPYQVATSDSDAVTDQEVISDHEMSTNEAPVEKINNLYCSGLALDSERSSANRPTATQNLTSPNNQRHPRFVLEQQMLDNFSTLVTQMGSTLRYTCDMYNNLRSSILETADTYRNLLDVVERFNVLINSTSNASSLSNSTPIVPQATEERHLEVTARANSSHENQHSNNVSDKTPKKIHNNLQRFVLPPEYDPHDTRWTLKYRTNLPGLAELVPQSGIYVNYGELKYCQQVSKDCKSLARRLLPEVFNRKALSVCLSINEKAQASNNVGSNLRPKLDEHASKVLLNFVVDYGLQCGWNTDLKPILSTLHIKIREIRLRSGVMVKC